MHYGTVKNCDIANGEGVRVSLFVSGCTNHCKHCFQPETWDFSYGQPFTDETEAEILRLLKNTAFTRAAENNRFADQLAQLTDHALQGQGGASAQEAFHNILSALLLDQALFPLEGEAVFIDPFLRNPSLEKV